MCSEESYRLNKYIKAIMKYKEILFLMIILIPAHAVSDRPNSKELDGFAQIESTITLPLANIERLVNEAVPQILTTINQDNQTCVKAEWLKTKVPKFKGLKIYTQTLKTKISPEIKCDIKGWVHRSGKINVTGNGEYIRIAIPVNAKISAKALVRETATASAIFFADLSFSLDENWHPSVTVTPSYQWQQKPTLKLFGLIKVRFTDKVDPHLRKELDKLAPIISKEIEKLNIRKELIQLWQQLYSPLLLEKNPLTTLYFIPTNISYNGFSIAVNALKTNIKISGKTAAYIGIQMPNLQEIPLPKLNKHSESNNQTDINTPITMGYSIIEKLFHQTYPDNIRFPLKDEESELEIFDLKVIYEGNGKIRLTTRNKLYNHNSWLNYIDIFDWGTTPFNTHIIGKPVIDPEKQTVRLDDIEVHFEAKNILIDKLIKLGFGTMTTQYLTPLLKYELSDDLQQLGQKIKNVMNTQYGPVMVSGVFDQPLIEDVIAQDKGLVTLWHISGSSTIKLDLLVD